MSPATTPRAAASCLLKLAVGRADEFGRPSAECCRGRDRRHPEHPRAPTKVPSGVSSSAATTRVERVGRTVLLVAVDDLESQGRRGAIAKPRDRRSPVSCSSLTLCRCSPTTGALNVSTAAPPNSRSRNSRPLLVSGSTGEVEQRVVLESTRVDFARTRVEEPSNRRLGRGERELDLVLAVGLHHRANDNIRRLWRPRVRALGPASLQAPSSCRCAARARLLHPRSRRSRTSSRLVPCSSGSTPISIRPWRAWRNVRASCSGRC